MADFAPPVEIHADRVRVLVVDDQATFRAAVADLVEATEGFELVGACPSGEAALEAVEECSPHLVILDKRMPGMNGVETCRRLTARHPELVVVLVSVEEPDETLTRDCGAVAFLRKQRLSPSRLREVWSEHGPPSG
jgi:DNA-binding NarL/FixJ family response regulator